MKLLIFDIDGTLTHLDGSTHRAFARAFKESFDRELITEGLKLHGRTDPIIFKECHARAGLNGDWLEAYEKFKPVYIHYLPEAISQNPRARTKPGVPELLAALHDRRDRCALALGTGNGEAGARAKISFFNLDDYFPVGGFGDTHEERYLIMQDAMREAEQYYQTEFDLQSVWIIGDTPFDIEGGQAIGAKTLAVATGGAYSYDDLVAAQPDVVMHDLSDTTAVLRALDLE
ncbi:HAD family hydrolase [bacterium]|nr:HAD family hydrolase [bacterium]